jgi:hypothetical protein
MFGTLASALGERISRLRVTSGCAEFLLLPTSNSFDSSLFLLYLLDRGSQLPNQASLEATEHNVFPRHTLSCVATRSIFTSRFRFLGDNLPRRRFAILFPWVSRGPRGNTAVSAENAILVHQ